MKNGIKLWSKMTNRYIKISLPILIFIFTVIVMFFIKPQYIKYVNESVSVNKQVVYIGGSILTLLGFMITLVNVFHEVIKKDLQIKNWLVLSKRQFYIYIFMKMIYWYYIYVMLMYLAIGELWQNIYFYVLTIIYIIVTYAIYLRTCSVMNKGNNKFHRNKNMCTLSRRLELFKKHPNMELVMFGWIYRYSFLDSWLCKIGVIGVGLFLLRQNLPEKLCFNFYFILFIILIFVDDNYWKKEIANVNTLRSIGVSFGKFFLINIVSGIVFHTIILALLYGLANQSIVSGIIFLFISICYICYWNSVYLYIYLSKIGQMDLIKMLLLAVVLIVSFIPIINIVVGVYFYRKTCIVWRKT